jgi:hypothetical protein
MDTTPTTTTTTTTTDPSLPTLQGRPSIAERRQRTREHIAAAAAAQTTADTLEIARILYGDDAVQTAFLTAVVRSEDDPTAFAYSRARGYMANERKHDRTEQDARKRYAKEAAGHLTGHSNKYASSFVCSDPTGDQAIADRSKLLAFVDTLVTSETEIAWDVAAATLGVSVGRLQMLVTARLHSMTGKRDAKARAYELQRRNGWDVDTLTLNTAADVDAYSRPASDRIDPRPPATAFVTTERKGRVIGETKRIR